MCINALEYSKIKLQLKQRISPCLVDVEDRKQASLTRDSAWWMGSNSQSMSWFGFITEGLRFVKICSLAIACAKFGIIKNEIQKAFRVAEIMMQDTSFVPCVSLQRARALHGIDSIQSRFRGFSRVVRLVTRAKTNECHDE